MTAPTWHPDAGLLLDYAVGTLSVNFAAAVSGHLTYCPSCRADLATIEAIGGFAVEGADAVPMSAGSLDAVFAALDEAQALAREPDIDPAFAAFPAPLRALIAAKAGGSWKKLARGIDYVCLDPKDRCALLLRVVPGGALPRHTHVGAELTLVVTGGFADHAGSYDRGDLVVADERVTHRPVADSHEGCTCYIVMEAPLRILGPLGWFLQLRAWLKRERA